MANSCSTPAFSRATQSFILLAVSILCSISVLVACAQAQQGDSGFKYLEVKLVDSEGNAPSEAGVEVSMDGISFPMMASDEGVVSLNVPSSGGGSLQLKVDCEGFASTVVSWARGEAIPTEYTIKMQKAVEIGGVVHDEQGNPVEGVTVVATNPLDRMARGIMAATISGELGTTDSEGRWSYAKAPEQKINVFLRITHPDYLDDGSRHPVTYEQLRAKDHTLVLKKGIELRGTVTSPLGMPVEGAKVALGGNPGRKDQERFTDADGDYLFGNLMLGKIVMTVYSPDYAPELKIIGTEKGMEPVDIRLEDGRPMRIRVTDPDGQPIAGVGVVADTWRGQRTLYQLGMPDRTDSEGLCIWKHAPTDEMQYDFWHGDFMSLRNQKLTAGRETHEIELSWPLEINGKVVDAETGAPIESFEVVQGMRWNASNNRLHWERYNIKQGSQGEFNVKYTEPRFEHLVRIEAPGYKPHVSRGIKSDEGLVELEIKLDKGTGPSGVVTLPDGSPAAGAELLMAGPGEQIYVYNGTAQQNESVKTTADDEGRYQLPYSDGNYAVVILHDQGWRQLRGEQINKLADVKLKEWARIEGVVKRGSQNTANERVSLNFSANNVYDPESPQVYWSYNSQASGEGDFVFEKLQSGSAVVGRMVHIGGDGDGIGHMSVYSHSTQVDLKPGETSQVQIGGEGRRVKGKFVVDEQFLPAVAWYMGQLQFNEQPPQINSAGGFFYQWGKAMAEGSGFAPSTTMAAQRQPDFRRSYASTINEQGEFEVYDVHPGTYRMSLNLYEKPQGRHFSWNSIGQMNAMVTVPTVQAATSDDAAEQEIVDLGEHRVEITINDTARPQFFSLTDQPTAAPVEVVESVEEEANEKADAE